MVYIKSVTKTPKTKPYELKSKTGSRNFLGGSGAYWNEIAKKSEARFKSKIEPLPDYDTFTDGWRERE